MSVYRRPTDDPFRQCTPSRAILRLTNPGMIRARPTQVFEQMMRGFETDVRFREYKGMIFRSHEADVQPAGPVSQSGAPGTNLDAAADQLGRRDPSDISVTRTCPALPPCGIDRKYEPKRGAVSDVVASRMLRTADPLYSVATDSRRNQHARTGLKHWSRPTRRDIPQHRFLCERIQ